MRISLVLLLGAEFLLSQVLHAATAECKLQFKTIPTQDSQSVAVSACDGHTVTLYRRPYDADSPEVWIGDLLQSAGETHEAGALFVFFDHAAEGLMFLNSEMYRVRPNWEVSQVAQPNILTAGTPSPAQALRLERLAPEDFPATHLSVETRQAAELQGLAAAPSSDGMAQIDVLLVYSHAAAEHVASPGGVEAHARFVQAVTNWSFMNHGLKIRVRVHAVQASTPDAGLDVPTRNLCGWLGGEKPSLSLDPVIDVISWVGDYEKGCGHISCECGCCGDPECGDDLPPHFGVNVRCAAERFGVAHELGHILGAGHQPRDYTLGNAHPTFEDGQATCSVHKTNPWATIMATIHRLSKTPCEPKSTILPFWSEPERCFLEEPLGRYGERNNVRVITENANKLAGANLKCVKQTFGSQQDGPESDPQP